MKKLTLLLLIFIITIFSFAQQTENLEDKFLSNTRQLIYDGNRSGEGYFSDNGQYLIFQSEKEIENPFYQIYILDFETGDINRVSPGHGKTTCAYFQWNGKGFSMLPATSIRMQEKNKRMNLISGLQAKKEGMHGTMNRKWIFFPLCLMVLI